MPYKIIKYSQRYLDSIVDLWMSNGYFKNISRNKLKMHLKWKYNSNFTTLWIAEQRGMVLGSCGRIFYHIIINGRFIIKSYWGVDSLVDKNAIDKNKLFVFFRVYRKAYRKKDEDIGFCFPNNRVKTLYLNTGWAAVNGLDKLSKSIVSEGRRGLKTNKTASGGLKFFWVDKFQSRWNNMLRKICVKYALTAYRNSRYLNWRYSGCHYKRYAILMAKKNSGIKGYMVLELSADKGARRGLIVDLLIDPQDRRLFDDFIYYAVNFFQNNKAGIIEFYTINSGFKNRLISLGFKRTDEVDFLILINKEKHPEELLNNPGKWHIVAGDGDFEMEG